MQNSIFFLLPLISIVQSITLIADKPFEYCFSKFVSFNDTITTNYMITGENENSITFKLYSPSGQDLKTIIGENNGEFQYLVLSAGVHRVCFRQTMQSSSLVSFNFYSSQEMPNYIKDMPVDGRIFKKIFLSK